MFTYGTFDEYSNFMQFQTALYTGWTVCTIMFLVAFIGPSKMGSLDYVYNPIHAAVYNAFAPIGWCGLFLWIAVMQHTGNSNGNYLKQCSKLTAHFEPIPKTLPYYRSRLDGRAA